MSSKDSYSIGIDFGTSNLKAGIFTGGKAKVQKLSKSISGKNYEPNIITRTKKKDGSYFFEIGDAAENALTDLDASNMKFVYNVKKHLCDESWSVTFHDGYCSDAIELSGKILEWLYQKIVAMKSGNIPENIVLTVPVTYSEMQVGRLRKAAEMANIPIDAVISEPVAAFFSFEECEEFLDEEEMDEDKYIFIIDFGGGTIDATLIELSITDNSHKISVKSSSGIRYGGSDITNEIIENIIYRSLDSSTVDNLKTAGYHFYHEIDNSKIRMFADEDDEIEESFVMGAKQIEYSFTVEQINNILEKNALGIKITKMIDNMLEDACVDKDEDDISVHLVGGGSCVSYFRNLVSEYFSDSDIDDYDEDETCAYVAKGAAFYSSLLSGDDTVEFENRSAYQIVGEFDNNVYLNRNALYGNKTIMKPIHISISSDGKRYMRFYQKFDSQSEKIYLGYLDLSSTDYDTGVLFDLMIRYDGRIEAEIYGNDNESLGKEIIITEEI